MQDVEKRLARLEELGISRKHLIFRDGCWWVSSKDLGVALGYKNGKAFSQTVNRHKDEFEGLTEMREIKGNGYASRTRFFNEEGCLIAAMHAKTGRQKELRRKVSEIVRATLEDAGIDSMEFFFSALQKSS